MSFVPYVVEQSSHGERSYDIFSRLLNDRIIVLSEAVSYTHLVKTRAEGSLASPAEAVDRPKQRRLIRAAQYYLQQNGLSDAPVRFDVAEVFPLDSGRWMVHIIKGAFWAKS